MKRTLLILCMSLAVFSCSSDGGTGTAGDPSDAPFDEPTGTLTAANADDVLMGAVDATGAANLNDPFGNLYSGGPGGLMKKLPGSVFKFGVNGLTADEVDEMCITTSGDTVTYDNGCILEDVDGCTGSGSFDVVNTSDEVSLTYNDLEFSCGEDEDAFSISCGSFAINFNTSNNEAFCLEGSCTITEDEEEGQVSVDACINADGEWLVDVEDETYVVNGTDLNNSCDSISATITDSAGANTVTCDVTYDGEDCEDDSLQDISAVENCSLGASL